MILGGTSIDVVSDVVASVLAGVTGSIRSSAQDGCSIDLENVAVVRELPAVHWSMAAGHAANS